MGLAQDANVRLVQRYLDWMSVSAKKSPATLHSYGRLYSLLLDQLGSRPLSAVSTADLYAFVARPRRGRIEAAPATIKAEVMTLRSLFKGLNHLELLASNPAQRLQAPTVYNEDPHPVSPEDWSAIWALPLSDDERVALGLGRFCGLRRAEICALAPSGFNGDTITTLVRKGGKRGGFKWRSAARFFEVRLPSLGASTFVESLEKVLCARQGRRTLLPWGEDRNLGKVTYEVYKPPFDGFVNPDQFNKRLVRMCLEADLEARAVTPHDLRHAFASSLIEEGVNVTVVSRLLGHASIQMTMRYVQAKDDPLGDMLENSPSSERLSIPGRW